MGSPLPWWGGGRILDRSRDPKASPSQLLRLQAARVSNLSSYRLRRQRRELKQLTAQMVTFLEQDVFADDRHRAMHRFLNVLARFSLLSDDSSWPDWLEDWLDESFVQWLLYDYRLNRGGRLPATPRMAGPLVWKKGETPAEVFLRFKQAENGIRPAAAQLVDTVSRSSIGIYEVRDVESPRVVRLWDVVHGQEILLEEDHAEDLFIRWQVLITRLYPAGDHWHTCSLPLAVSPWMRTQILADVASQARRSRRKSGGMDRFLKEDGLALCGAVLASLASTANSVQLVTPEGDPVLYSRADYRLTDPKGAVELLSRSDAFSRLEENGRLAFQWLEDAPPPEAEATGVDPAWSFQRILGTVTLTRSRLRLDCPSRRRLAAGKARLEQLLGSRIAHRADSFSRPEEPAPDWMNTLWWPEGPVLPVGRAAATGYSRGGRRGSGQNAGAANDVMKTLGNQYLRQYYERWLDMPIPALDGFTPREAAAEPRMHQRLEDLLKELEYNETLKKRAGQPYFDAAILRRRLGFGSESPSGSPETDAAGSPPLPGTPARPGKSCPCSAQPQPLAGRRPRRPGR